MQSREGFFVIKSWFLRARTVRATPYDDYCNAVDRMLDLKDETDQIIDWVQQTKSEGQFHESTEAYELLTKAMKLLLDLRARAQQAWTEEAALECETMYARIRKSIDTLV